MAILAKLHSVITAGNIIVARHAAVGVVAGDAGEVAASAPLRRIGFVGDRMTAAVAEGKDMYPFANRLMTGEAEFVDRLMELLRVLTGVVIMADFAHTGCYRAMEELE